MMIAQAVAEYGLLSALAANAREVSYEVQNWIAEASPLTWAVIVGVILVALWGLIRR